MTLSRDAIRQMLLKSPHLEIEPSEEQIDICHALQTSNGVVDAIAGSGKTSTILMIAITNPELRILVLTFNVRLRDETKYRFRELPHVSVNNYHSYVVQMYGYPCKDDRQMKKFLASTTAEDTLCPTYDLIILDEVQDMTPLLYRTVMRILADMRRDPEYQAPPQMAILGDKRQSIYEFIDSDSRFLTLAARAFGHVNRLSWTTSLKLSTSYRMTHQMANMINECYLAGENRLHACRDGPKPLYFWVDFREFISPNTSTVQRIIAEITKHGPGNTFILAPSIKNPNHPCQRLENLLSGYFNLPTYVALGDDRDIHAAAAIGKIVISTQCSAKGMERSLAILWGCDDAPWNKYTSQCSADNRFYVALTRAKHQLVLIHAYQEKLFRYTCRNDIFKHCEFRTTCIRPENWLPLQTKNHKVELRNLIPGNTAVTELLRFQSTEFIDDMLADLVQIEEVKAAMVPEDNLLVDVPSVTPTRFGHCEEVSDISGKLFQHVVEYDLLGTSLSIGLPCTQRFDERPPVSELAKLAVESDAFRKDIDGRGSGYTGRYYQIPSHGYHWISEDHIEEARRRCSVVFKGLQSKDHPTIRAEEKISINLNVETECCLRGYVDFVEDMEEDGNSGSNTKRLRVWEVKFVSEITPEHIMQAFLYGYMYWRKSGHHLPPEVLIYNIRTDQLLSVAIKTNSHEECLPSIVELVYRRYDGGTTRQTDDETFLRSLAAYQ